jgi:hypothetical protein
VRTPFCRRRLNSLQLGPVATVPAAAVVAPQPSSNTGPAHTTNKNAAEQASTTITLKVTGETSKFRNGFEG